MSNDIAIIGMGITLPNGIEDLNSLWNLILNGKNLVKKFPLERANDLEEYIGYLKKIGLKAPETKEIEYYDGCYFDSIKKFDNNLFNLSPKIADVMDPQMRLLLKTIYKALEDSGYSNPASRSQSMGVFIGFAANPGGMYSEYLYKIDYSLSQIALTGTIPSMFANRISYMFNLHGPSFVVDCACSSSLVAVHNAKQAILLGDCDSAIVAGSRLVFSPVKSKSGSIGIESPDGYTRTFDIDANGTGYGEGAGAIIIKKLDKAKEDGDNIYAILKGSAVNHDGHKDSITTPDQSSQSDLIKKAWDNTNITEKNPVYIEVHGTETHIGDPIEISGLKNAEYMNFMDKKIALGTIKTNIGHLYEGSGIMGIIKTALVLKNNIIPPMANFTQVNPILEIEGTPFFIPKESSRINSAYEKYQGCVSAFGLGGTNCHIILENYISSLKSKEKIYNKKNYLFTISAKTDKSLIAYTEKIRKFIENSKESLFESICYTSNFSRQHLEKKLGCIVESKDELVKILKNLSNFNYELSSQKVVTNLHLWNCHIKNTGINKTLNDWLNSNTLNFKELYSEQTIQKISLPPYEFDERECWVEFPNQYTIQVLKNNSDVLNQITYSIRFKPTEFAKKDEISHKTLILVEKYSRFPLDFTSFKGANIYKLSVDYSEINKDTEKHITAKIDELLEFIYEHNFENIIYALADENENCDNLKTLQHRVKKNLYTLFLFTKRLIQEGFKLQISILTINSLKVFDDKAPLVPENSSMSGFIKVVQREFPYLKMKLIDISEDFNQQILENELYAKTEGTFAIRNNTLYKEVFEEIDLDNATPKTIEYIKDNSLYLITGGTGGLGLAIANYFAKKNKTIRLALLCRSKIPPKSEWNNIIENDTNNIKNNTLNNLIELSRTGISFRCYQCDVSDEISLSNTIEQIHKDFGKITGVIHAAGIPRKNILQARTLEDFDSVIKPKIFGTYILEELTKNDNPDFYLFFSSVATVFPSAGQADYAAGNYYLDTISYISEKKRKITCDWVAWKEIGMAKDYGTNQDTTFKALKTSEGLNIIDKALSGNTPRIFGGKINYEQDLIQLLTGFHVKLSDEIEHKIKKSLQRIQQESTEKVLSLKKEIDSIEVTVYNCKDCNDKVTLLIARCWSHCLGFTEFNADADFTLIGGDSIAALSIVSELSIYLGKEINLASFISNSTINKLCDFIKKNII